MNTAKIGVIFIVAAMALEGIGAGYSAWFDTITVEGTVNTGSVGWHFIDYSGTYVWKVYGAQDTGFGPETVVTDDSTYSVDPMYGFRVAYAEAVQGQDDHSAIVTYYNLFPSIDFEADVEIIYTGTIPGKISDITFTDIWPEDADEVLIDQYTTLTIDIYDAAGVMIEEDLDLGLLHGYQLHEGYKIHVIMTIHLPQNDAYMNLNGDFGVSIEVMQWNELIQINPQYVVDNQLTVTGTGWKSASAWLNPDGYDFATNHYSFDLTDACSEPIALQGFIDTTQCAIANPSDWSKYYAIFSIRDSSDKHVNVVFGNDWLGPWYEMPAQQWDRIRMENNMALAQPERYYATVGGVLGYDMNGVWVGPGNGAIIYPSSEIYYFQLIADPLAETFTLQVYAMGSGAPANPPSAWPTQNMYDYPTWLEIGSIVLGAGDFNFEAVEFEATLWASTQAGPDETSTVSWYDMHVGIPLDFSETP